MNEQKDALQLVMDNRLWTINAKGYASRIPLGMDEARAAKMTGDKVNLDPQETLEMFNKNANEAKLQGKEDRVARFEQAEEEFKKMSGKSLQDTAKEFESKAKEMMKITDINQVLGSATKAAEMGAKEAGSKAKDGLDLPTR